ncbi:iron ABC transporter permease [Inquilinus sp. CAU 1745]|uniref:ABC transporter permease n=1 Tax=Inquilinus sp. CAU 1745 TaxID=3140369 RepID=UPI00325AFF57
MLVPLVYLVVRALDAEPAVLWDLIVRPRTAALFANTIALTLGVLAFTTAIALPLAWLTTRSDLAGRKAVTVLAALPLAVPGYVMAYALIGLSGNYGFMAQVVGIRLPRPEGYWGAVLALGLYTFPYLFLNLRAALSGLDPSLAESARSLGCTPWQTFRRVTLPHLKPAFFSGWLVIGLYTLGDFGAVALMRFEAFSYVIYTQYSGAFDRVYAAWLSILLMTVSLSMIWIEGKARSGLELARTGTGSERRFTPIRLGRWTPLAWGFIALVVLASLGLPAAVLSFWLSLEPVLPSLPDLLEGFLHSIAAAVPAAILAGLLALPIAYLTVRHPSRPATLIDRLAFLGYATPPLTFALAMVFFSLGAVPWLYQSLALLIIAYALHFLVLALGPIRSSLLQARPALEESARSLGYGPVRAFAHAVLPLLRRGIVAGMALVFIIAMKELPIAFLLSPAGFRTLAINVFSRTVEGMLANAAPYAAAIVIFSGLMIGVVLAHEGKRE